ncbi:winged helix-turn-helix domain-containing protein [uncultured Methanobrevibacter sp.]|uniref:helix-turn-helix transcriptional regulator n=1 Tax=uncultured Methanobrevibacter sp. TaxID=253161 RepID=UPI00261926C9|nr:transcriptional regulator FilR1 domain-containing protein [uncultured Methanobrevibacter sp.]
MNKNQKSINHYESISEEIKHLTNSLVRLKILATLYEQPLNMKDINKTTGLSYSSISSNMFSLELEEYIYREGNFYFISNVAKFYISNILELNNTIKLLNKFFNILDAHIVDMIPEESVAELYLLGKAILIESTEKDIYKTYNIIKHSLKEAGYLKSVLPFVHDEFNICINNLIDAKNSVDILVPESIEKNFKDALNLRNDCLNLSTFNNECNFLLVVTDKVMILGLFRNDGNFDQNRIITSKKEECIKWGENLFENFKNNINK